MKHHAAFLRELSFLSIFLDVISSIIDGTRAITSKAESKAYFSQQVVSLSHEIKIKNNE